MSPTRKRIWRPALFALVLVASTAFITARVVSDDKKPEAGHAPTQAEMDMMAAMNPGPNHKLLEQFLGEWNCVSKFTMDPSAPPTECKASAKFSKLFDGRFITQEYDSTFDMPGPDGKMQPYEFHGRGLMGYDNLEKKFVSAWVDSMGTGIYTDKGTCDSTGKLFNMYSEFMDPMSGKLTKGKSVLTIKSKDMFVFEMSKERGPGQWVTELEIRYTRK